VIFRGPVDDFQQGVAHDTVVLAQLCETRLDFCCVDFVVDLVADLPDKLAQIAEVEVAAVLFFKLLLESVHCDRRLLGELVVD